MSFSELTLHPALLRNLERMGYVSPRPIQAQAIGPIIEGRDIIGLAQTGTGKTAAFGVGVAHRLLVEGKPAGGAKGKDQGKKKRTSRSSKHTGAGQPRALVLCPTRELAQQVEREIAALVNGSVLRTLCVYGKVGMQRQVDALAEGVDILVGTTGRVHELIEAHALSLASVQVLTIDEADRMLDMGFAPQVERILGHIPPHPQTLLFTATMPADVEALAQRHLERSLRIEVGRHTTTVEHVTQHALLTSDSQKVPLLLDLLSENGKERSGVLVFCRTKRRVGWVGAALRRHGVTLGTVHGDRTQSQRQRSLSDFAAGNLRVLVATDVAARGLHIEAVKTVVNYDLPVQPEEYVHRVGRAGHGGGEGEAFTLLTSGDENAWATIERVTGGAPQPKVRSGFGPGAENRRERQTRAGDGDGSGFAGGAGRAAGGQKKSGFRSGKQANLPEPISKHGNVKRRSARSRPVRNERPGTGVRRVRPDRGGGGDGGAQ